MEAKKEPASSSPPAPSSSSLVADLFGEKNAPPNPSASPFHSVFPPAPTVVRKHSSRSAVVGPSEKHEVQSQKPAQSNAEVSRFPETIPEGNGQRDNNPAYQHQKINPCSFSSSLYYGGRDFYFNVSPESKSDDKNDGEHDLDDPNAASRGNWWQGSLYY